MGRSSSVERKAEGLFATWRADWNTFIRDAFGVTLDSEQQAIVTAVQHNRMVSVRSGTARGKDFVSACIAMCFLYLTPRWNAKGEMVENTKVALTAPTDRQVKNIMLPEISRLFNRARKRGYDLPGRLSAYDIRTDNEEWFLTGFKADEHNHEAWSGFHAVNTMFIVTEATGIKDDTFEAIEGNLQGNSRILLVFNPNTTVGYAARSQKSDRWAKFCLNSLNAPNVAAKKTIIPGQVDYEWAADKVRTWCEPISASEVLASENDFEWEGQWYRPSDLARKKLLGEFPKVDEDVLIPLSWIEAAQERWKDYRLKTHNEARIGVDVAGMGRDCTVFCERHGDYVTLDKQNSGGRADHMRVAGRITHMLETLTGSIAMIDTIGEGAGVYAACLEHLEGSGLRANVISCKFSEAARTRSGRDYTDRTGQYKFANMRAYLFWMVREWLDPDNGTGAMLPPGGTLAQEATEIRWSFKSDGRIIIEPKDDIKRRLGFSPDEFDSLANTFYPAVAVTRHTQAIYTQYEEDALL